LPAQNASLFFECFPYVCPEPVLVKCSFLYINGAKSGVFRTAMLQDPVVVVVNKRTRLAFLSVPLRLSRACLGKFHRLLSKQEVETPLFEPFIYTNDQFTKTGSGQT
jgi:hypothetical protein